QVHGLLVDDDARRRHDHRLGVPERGSGDVADRHPAVDAGLVDADRHAGLGGGGARSGGEHEGENGFHGWVQERGCQDNAPPHSGADADVAPRGSVAISYASLRRSAHAKAVMDATASAARTRFSLWLDLIRWDRPAGTLLLLW